MDIKSNNLVECISLFIVNPKIPFYEIGYWASSQLMGKGLLQKPVFSKKYFLPLFKVSKIRDKYG